MEIRKITGYSERTSEKGNKYHQFLTAEGNFNVFDADKIEALIGLVGKYARLNLQTRGKWTNLNNVPQEASNEELLAIEQPTNSTPVFVGNNGADVKPTPERVTTPEPVSSNEMITHLLENPKNTLLMKTPEIIHEHIVVDERPNNWVEVGPAAERIRIKFHNKEDLAKQLKEYLVTVRNVMTQLNGSTKEETKE